MKIEEFDYTLSPSLIAQYPPFQRGDSKLMVLHRSQGIIEHRYFHDILEYIHSGDLLVVNNTRVLPARLFGEKESGGKVEFLLIPPSNGNKERYEIIMKKSRKIKEGDRIQFGQDLYGFVEEMKQGKGKISFSKKIDVKNILQKLGHTPLPPYIKREDTPIDRERYQTIFAEKDGSIAAPTAGIHFTLPILQSFKSLGVNIASITLHIGPGTFAPVRVNEVKDHRMDAEWVEVLEEVAKEIEKTKSNGKKVIAVGTSTTRALESFSREDGKLRSGKGMTNLFIYPPYRFRIIDGLVTNFHLPKSTLIMLVSAFAGKGFLNKAYQEAINRNYKFYSYGDAMLIL